MNIISNFFIYRLSFTAMVVAIKFFDDIYYMNSLYAKIGGISTKELNFLEISFLKMIRYDLLVNRDTFDGFYKEMNRNYN